MAATGRKKERTQKVSAKIKEKLGAKNVIESYAILRLWCRSYDGNDSNPTEETLEKVQSSYDKLYTKDDLGDDLPFDFQYEGGQILDEVPSDRDFGISFFGCTIERHLDCQIFQ